MRQRRQRPRVVASVLLVVLLGGGCATTTRQPVRLEESFFEENPSELFLLPAAVVMGGVSEGRGSRNLAEYRVTAEFAALDALGERGYAVTYARDIAEVWKEIPPQLLERADLKDVSELGPLPQSVEFWVLLRLERLDCTYAVLEEQPMLRALVGVSLSVTASLVARGDCTELWRDTIDYQDEWVIAQKDPEASWVLFGLAVSEAESAMFDTGMRRLFSTLPKCPKRR